MIRRSRSGFTLIELIIVIGIIAVLVVVLVAVLLNAQSSGEKAKAKNFVNTVIPAAIGKWQEDTGKGNNEFPRSGNNRAGAYYDGNVELYKTLVLDPAKTSKGAYVGDDQYLKGEHDGKPVFVDPWGRPYVYRNYTAKRARGASEAEYRGKKHNDTYDIISAGPDGVIDNDDDIYNGSN
ncbi:MAG: prepilin-type N-terminal cleavage/methylation domain-containing protein [Planctomycetes bacterium]|jgi:prepilin-type N-terminal cleavage/methylation domain-containing protein|nr:prepilin-type N-terminal cleavage/methylation domain-containing protein [Planctomycetota bacterium]MCL4729691.1 prepilin-type N-terminal cleavage/methylation domain-containing protein [Planctomycetota bacterium]